jgi:hypothetical protein
LRRPLLVQEVVDILEMKHNRTCICDAIGFDSLGPEGVPGAGRVDLDLGRTDVFVVAMEDVLQSVESVAVGKVIFEPAALSPPCRDDLLVNATGINGRPGIDLISEVSSGHGGE